MDLWWLSLWLLSLVLIWDILRYIYMLWWVENWNVLKIGLISHVSSLFLRKLSHYVARRVSLPVIPLLYGIFNAKIWYINDVGLVNRSFQRRFLHFLLLLVELFVHQLLNYMTFLYIFYDLLTSFSLYNNLGFVLDILGLDFFLMMIAWDFFVLVYG